jgi:hypothetical protein
MIMEKIKGKISGFGAFLSLAGLISAVVTLFDYELRILMWIENWGTAVGWLIRFGLIVGGAFICYAFRTKEEKEAEERAAAAERAAAEFDWDGYRSAVRADSRFAEFMSRVNKDFDVSFEKPSDGDTFHIRHYAFSNVTGQTVPPDSGDITNLTLYLNRDRAPKRMLIGAQFKGGSMGEPESMELSSGQWGHLVPAAAVEG